MGNMGFLVIVHVDTIDDAKKLAKSRPGRSQTPVDNARVVGVFRMPSRDEPVCAGLSGCKATGWKRMSPDGHMVHACGHRNRDYRQRLAGHAGGLLDTYGINLLARDHTPRLFRNPVGWDREDGVARGSSSVVEY